MPRTQIAALPHDPAIRTLTGDPDSCIRELRPLPPFGVKLRDGALIFISRWGLSASPIPVHPHAGKAFRTILNLPGTADQWVVEEDVPTNTLRARRPGIQLAFALRVIGRTRIEIRVRFGQRPPSDSLRLGYTVDAGVSLRVDAAGELEFMEGGEPYLKLGAWSGRSALGNPAGARWRVDASDRLWIDLITAEWDALGAGDYPVVMD
jgi:hypothetical protein